MKKQYLLLFFFVLLLSNAGQAQDNCCPQVKNSESTAQVKLELMDEDKVHAIIGKEIELFTDYINQNLEYPKSAEYTMLEGEMRVRIVYENGFDRIAITKSIHPGIDEMVLHHIGEYVNNFDREYAGAPRLVFDLPITFRMTNW